MCAPQIHLCLHGWLLHKPQAGPVSVDDDDDDDDDDADDADDDDDDDDDDNKKLSRSLSGTGVVMVILSPPNITFLVWSTRPTALTKYAIGDAFPAVGGVSMVIFITCD